MAVVILSWTQLSLAAQEKNGHNPTQGDTIDLEKIIVTPMRQKTLLRDTPSKVTVISKEQIIKTGARTLDELFQYIPEVNVIGNSIYQGMKPQITMRGVPNQERTLVMIDGIPVNSAWQGRVEWGMVPIEAIERIELVHGPMSTLYGSGAMGGAINIVTKSARERSETSLKGQYGSLNTWSTALHQGGKFDKFSYYLGGSIVKSKGYIPEKNPQPYSVRRSYKDWDSLFKLNYSIDEYADFALGFLHDDEKTCRGREYFNINDRANLGYLTYERPAGNIKLKATFFINDQDWKREFDTGPDFDYLNMIENIDNTYLGTMTQATFTLLEINRLTAGLDYKNGRIRLKDEYQQSTRKAGANGRQDLVAVFLQDELRFLEDSLILSLGLRGDYCRSYKGWTFDTGQAPKVSPFSYDYNDRDWTALSPKASLVYHFKDKTTLRASFGSAFHAPDLKELYMVLARPTKTVYNNPNLDPEILNSYEIGINQNFFSGLEGGLSFFYSRGKDFISTRTLSASTFIYDNIDKVRMYGVETDLKYRIDGRWSCSAGYFFHSSKIDKNASNPDLNGNYLAMQPTQRAKVSITYQNPKIFTASALLRYVGRMYADNENSDKLKSYFVCDLQMSKRLNKNIELSLTWKNILDKKYDIPNEAGEDLKSPGRMIVGSVTIEW